MPRIGLEIDCLAQAAANVVADRRDQQSEQERQAPAPGIDLLGRQRRRDDKTETGRQHAGNTLRRIANWRKTRAA